MDVHEVRSNPVESLESWQNPIESLESPETHGISRISWNLMESPESHGISRNLTESQNLTESLESHRIFKILNPRSPKFGVANPRSIPVRRAGENVSTSCKM
ncbi:hypothetical protein DAPPUDRAFT_273712 [Daphnia pulex]|uniref:Uncharacterized protein n=1 Tax=Daphnia pulex TaxID=6669 RepID=E9I3N3_DAPPU|nr:hypothetical protein DAPPUDRAFT_273712 [Daphnia pulex]|eukprot:EFX61397.1 hypothetical protein DAPPUDRAFT_273712 [Daphnia pulex]